VLALGGTMVVRGQSGEREVAASDFFTGFLETALAPDELLAEIRVPKVPTAGWSFQKLTKRAQDWAIVGAAVVRNGVTGIGLVNMDSTPVRASATEQALAGGASIADAAAVADQGASPSADINASEEFRRHLARVLVRRGLEEASK
jgi:aerobic carbon-monoxide dehydrogenase medium subunit